MHVGDENDVDVSGGESDLGQNVFWIFPVREGVSLQPVAFAKSTIDERDMLLAADLTADDERVDHRDLHDPLVAIEAGPAKKIVRHIRLTIGERPNGVIGVACGMNTENGRELHCKDPPSTE
jgi:hypothetical protein